MYTPVVTTVTVSRCMGLVILNWMFCETVFSMCDGHEQHQWLGGCIGRMTCIISYDSVVYYTTVYWMHPRISILYFYHHGQYTWMVTSSWIVLCSMRWIALSTHHRDGIRRYRCIRWEKHGLMPRSPLGGGRQTVKSTALTIEWHVFCMMGHVYSAGDTSWDQCKSTDPYSGMCAECHDLYHRMYCTVIDDNCLSCE